MVASLLQSLCWEIIRSSSLFGILCSLFINMAFVTDVREFQALLDACVSVRDWETLTESIQIPETILPMAYARLTELTLEETEVSFIFIVC